MDEIRMAVKTTRQAGTMLLCAVALFALFAGQYAQVASAQRFDPSPQAAPATGDAAGLLGTTAYQSPQFGYRVDWRAPWVADMTATESNQAIALDRLSMISGTARFQVFFVAAEGEMPAEYAERFIDFRMSYEPTTKIVGSGERRGVSWIAYRFESQGQTASGVVEISLTEDGNALQVVEVMEFDEAFDDAFELANDLIQIEGGPPFRVLTGWPAQTNSPDPNGWTQTPGDGLKW